STTDELDSEATPDGGDRDPTAGPGGRKPDSSEAAGADQTPDRSPRQRRSNPSSQGSVDSDYVDLPSPTPPPSPRRAPRQAKKTPRTFVVARVIDGDTVELGNGQGVRLVGIDTPERGECGFDTATANLVRLVEGKRVRLTQPDEDTDRYGRLLRYLNIGDVDPGLRLIKNGLAIARYDSRDGYGYHPREPTYVAADKASKNRRCAARTPTRPGTAPKKPAGNCAVGYAPCIPAYPPDVNCTDVTGPISVRGSDPHELDADGDGIACE
ncbi:MAG: thermonuclease family protein, partial [Ornithinimicrobium sp.]